MKIYTRKGDQGLTALIGGTRVPKHHLCIEAYGTVDELNSVIGLVKDHQPANGQLDLLASIQNRLFEIGATLASDPNKSRMTIPDLRETDITALEQAMDEMDAQLPELKAFILPGGHPAVSFCHLARCVCRRAERLAVHLAASKKVAPKVVQYLNRLSDYLFVLARWVGQELKVEETPWVPRKA